MSQASMVQITSRPAIADIIQLRNIQLPLPTAPDSWHRPARPQPCTASIRASYASSVASAAGDDVNLTIDYGKLYRQLEADIGQLSPAAGQILVNADGVQLQDLLRGELGEDVRLAGGIVAKCCLQQLEETASRAASANSPSAIQKDFGEFEVRLHLPKAILRADGGLHYRSVTAMGHVAEGGRRLLVLEEEFEIQGIRSYCILGINQPERLEKQAVNITLRFQGSGLQEWSSRIVDTYQEMTRVVAERVETTFFGSAEALATLVARTVTLDFAIESVTVVVEKPSALAFVEGSGLEITRSRGFFQS